MPYSSRVKRLAYGLDPPCWRSYSGMFPSHKRRLEARRIASLKAAQRFVNAIDEIKSRISKRAEVNMPPMKIAMMLHFATVAGPFSTYFERRHPPYVKFVRELLAEGMIVRTAPGQRIECPDWDYMGTDKGCVYVEALRRVPLPVRAKPEWVMPASGGWISGGDEGPHGSDRYRPGDTVPC